MARANKIVNHFSSGEWSPRMTGRTDVESYHSACLTMENFLLTMEGGVDSRPGTVFVANGSEGQGPVSHKIRLIPFELAADNYVLELGDGVIRFYKGSTHELIYDGANPYEEATIWGIDDVFDIKYIQSEDTMYFVHPGYKPQQLTRTDDTDWTMGDIAWAGAESFDDANHRPGAITIFENRLVFAGSNNRPGRVWMSVTDTWNDFQNAGALTYDLFHDRRLFIRWLVAKNVIVFGADCAEGIITGDGAALDAVENIGRQFVESRYGTANIQGILVGDKVFFAQKGGRRIRALGYRNEIGSWTSPDITWLADHITGSGIVEAELQTNPDVVYWAINEEGELIGFTYEEKYGIFGWHRHRTRGSFESIAIIPGETEDEIWVSVLRTVDGETKRFVEYFKTRKVGDDQTDVYHLDCGITEDNLGAYSITGVTQAQPVVVTCAGHPFANGETVRITEVEGSTELNNHVYTVQNAGANDFELAETDDFAAWNAAITYPVNSIVEDGGDLYIATEENLNKQPTLEPDYWDAWPTAYTDGGVAQRVVDTIAGLEHLEGELVSVIVDGATHPDVGVVGGEIELDHYANKIHVGLGYTATLELMPLNAGASRGTAVGQMMDISALILRVYKSLGGKAGPDEDHLQIIYFRTAADEMDSPPELYTGNKRITFPSGVGDEGNIMVIQDQPLPLNILALVAELDVYD